ncbi:anti-sigma regulatory factor (Ser/Thr protein kinase) [Streptosporangium becharense]|uniref:Anti-sigma regulatory factor (Ser/Thr protein kinase) n=1 Tax=Streptosporangium becharense TaxID=1816182 RepID=A0A7W9IC34_9ACTN|nr:ATP-binding protein [Streptosporangium becharense]MBB2915203.1 anti-sigma regulatory factor (Ser/Thr protein kinase) [Streptosporangium becharense]MBB5817968.1 anti-sigma regulatory factor (Ser/Thr protein kinase) [Streptosporangium becharense]
MRPAPDAPANPPGPHAEHPTDARTGHPGGTHAGHPSGARPARPLLPGGKAAPGTPAEARPGAAGVSVTALHPGSASRRARAVVREVLRAAGVSPDDVADAETAAAELAANCERHAHPPYELRLLRLAGVPVWCELLDGDPDLGWIPALLGRSRPPAAPDPLAESGRGLVLVRELSLGHCRAYLTTASTGAPAKAVAFALPTRSGTRLTGPPRPDPDHRPRLRP